MPPTRLRLKIIKDARLGPVESGVSAGAQLRLLDMSMLPFTLYVRIQLPAGRIAQQPIFLHLIGRTRAADATERFFAAARLPEPSESDTPEAPRRILLLLIGDDIADGRFRLALVQDRQHLAFIDLVKRADQLRVANRAPAALRAAPRPLLISGTHKSGTTWLEKVIDAHPDFIVLHEANTFNILDPAGLRRLVGERQEHFRYKDYIRWLNPRFDIEDFSRFLQISLAKDLILRLGAAWGSPYVADRTPGYCGLYRHLVRFWEELRIIHIVRHPLDVLVSRLFHEVNLDRNASRTTDIAGPMLQTLDARLDSGEPLLPGEFVSDADAAGATLGNLLRDWRRDQEHYLAARAFDPHPFHLVKYEDLLDRFEAEAGRLFAFLDVDPVRTDLVAIQRKTTFRALSGGRASGEADARSFFRKGVVGDWRHVFSARQAALLWPTVGEIAPSFGYTLI